MQYKYFGKNCNKSPKQTPCKVDIYQMKAAPCIPGAVRCMAGNGLRSRVTEKHSKDVCKTFVIKAVVRTHSIQLVQFDKLVGYCGNEHVQTARTVYEATFSGAYK